MPIARLALHHHDHVQRGTVSGDQFNLPVDPVIHPTVVIQQPHIVDPPSDQRHATLSDQRLLSHRLPWPRRHRHHLTSPTTQRLHDRHRPFETAQLLTSTPTAPRTSPTSGDSGHP